MRHQKQQGLYRGVQVGRPMTVAEKIKGGKEAYNQMDDGEELAVSWNGTQYEVRSIDFNTITKFDTLEEVNEAYNTYIYVK